VQLTLTAATGIHGQPALEVDGQTLSAQSQSGDVNIVNLNTSGTVVTVETLTTGSGSIAFTQAAGDLTVVDASTADGGIAVETASGTLVVEEIIAGNGPVMLGTLGSGDVVTSGTVSGSSVTIRAADSVVETATGDITTTGGSISVEALSGSIVMADGAVNNSAGGNIVYEAAGDVIVGSLNAGSGDVSITATGGTIQGAGTDARPEVTADGLKLVAAGGVGTSTQPFDTDVSVIVASAGSGGLHLLNAGDLEIGTVGPMTTEQVLSDGTVVVVTEEPLSGLTAGDGGSVVQRVTDGTLNVNAPIQTSGSGEIILQARDVTVNAALVSESDLISIVTQNGATLSWTAVSGATGYYLEIVRNGAMFESLLVTGTSWTPTYTCPQGDYTWTVRPVTAAGMGPASAPGSFRIVSLPEALAPSGVKTSGASLAFRWTAITGATRYQILITKDGVSFASAWIDGATVWTPALTFDAGVYQWTVQSWSVEGYGLTSDITAFVITVPGAAGQPTALNPTGSLPDGSPTFSWTAVPGIRWYRLTILKDGQVFVTQFLDNVTTWTPDVAFGTGTYRWTVQSWRTVGYGTVSAPAEFAVVASPLSQTVLSGSSAVLDGGGLATSGDAPALSGAAREGMGAVPGESFEASAADIERTEASSGIDEDASAFGETAVRVALGLSSGTAGIFSPADPATPSATADGEEQADQDSLSVPDVEATRATAPMADLRMFDSAIPADGQASTGRGAMFLSAQTGDRKSRPVSSGNAEESGADRGQDAASGMDLVNARRGYIAPIKIVVGPMNDPETRQALLTAKKIADKPDDTV
jgi:hypothetical protein